MKGTNAAKKVSGNVPAATMIARWIETAKSMTPGVEY